MRRAQLIPWKAAGRVSEQMASGDDVVRQTGWVFNNATGDSLTLAEFVETGDHEVPAYLETFGLRTDENQGRTLVEIGSGIGRMTCAFTREFGSVVACDLDPGFLERCYETVGRFGKVERLRTLEVADGRSLDLADRSADVAFSYITLQHCATDDALALSEEAVRVTRPGGTVVLNYRGPSGSDVALLPAGAVVRALYRIPKLGGRLSRTRSMTRLAWQVSRLRPEQVLARIGGSLTDVQIWTSPSSSLRTNVGTARHFDGINPSHWWLVATVR
jgi:SAM-dependent methyltransferase